MSSVRRSPYVTIEVLENFRVVLFVRSGLPFGDVQTAREELSHWLPALDGIDTTEFGVLLDFRHTPMTSDPDILSSVVSVVERIGAQFPRHAILLAAALLGSQSERIARASGTIPGFTDEAEAWSYVRGQPL